MPVIAQNETEPVYPCKCRKWEHRNPITGTWHQPLIGCSVCGGWYFDKDYKPVQKKLSLTNRKKKK